MRCVPKNVQFRILSSLTTSLCEDNSLNINQENNYNFSQNFDRNERTNFP